MNRNRYGAKDRERRQAISRRSGGARALRVRRIALILALSLFLVPILGIAQPAQGVHLTENLVRIGEPINDHYVANGTFAFTNFAQGSVLWGTGSGTTIRRGFIEWDLTAIPAGSAIISASFAVFQSSSPSIATQLLFCQVTSAWSESSITFNTQPTIGACPLTFDADTIGGVKNITLPNSFIRSWVENPTTNFGFRMNLTDESAAVFGSQSGGFEGREFNDPHPGDTTPSATLYVTFTFPPTQTELFFPVIAVVGAIVVALGFFNLALDKKRRTLENLVLFLVLLLVFLIGISIAVAFVLT